MPELSGPGGEVVEGNKLVSNGEQPDRYALWYLLAFSQGRATPSLREKTLINAAMVTDPTIKTLLSRKGGNSRCPKGKNLHVVEEIF